MSKSRGPRKRHWMFTHYVDVLPTIYEEKVVRYIIYQREICPETKRMHYQGYVEFHDNVRKGQVQKLIGNEIKKAHCEPRKGSRTQARNYCRKAETAMEHTQFEFGMWREEVNRKRKLNDMLLAGMTIDDIIKVSPADFVRNHRGLEKLAARRAKAKAKVFRPQTVKVYLGATGTGKTKRATSGADWFILPCGDKLWFDGYDGEDTLIIDDFYGNIKYSTFLRMLDGHMLPVPIKGGFVYSMWHTVIITSNQHPRDWYTRGYTAALKRRVTEIVHFPANVGDLVINFV